VPSLGQTKLGVNGEQVVQRYLSGDRAAVLCAEYNVNLSTLRRHLVTNGVVLRDERAGRVLPTRRKLVVDKPKQQRGKPHNFINLSKTQVVLLYNVPGATLNSVAKQLGVCKPVVQRLINEAGANKPNKISGQKHPWWRPHLTDEERANRRDYNKQKVWREAVFKRDGYVCQACGANQGGNLNAHHIVAHADNRVLRWEESNGVTLCKTCHKQFHAKYGKQGFGPAQLVVFLQEKCHA
jgi:5-methylcytosine-specific restriction endonuclease McrA